MLNPGCAIVVDSAAHCQMVAGNSQALCNRELVSPALLSLIAEDAPRPLICTSPRRAQPGLAG